MAWVEVDFHSHNISDRNKINQYGIQLHGKQNEQSSNEHIENGTRIFSIFKQTECFYATF